MEPTSITCQSSGRLFSQIITVNLKGDPVKQVIILPSDTREYQGSESYHGKVTHC